MARKHNAITEAQAQETEAQAQAQAQETEAQTEPNTDELAAKLAALLAEANELRGQLRTQNGHAPKTIVPTKYKRTYHDRAKAAGYKDKASKRGNGDWLQRELQAETVGKSGVFDLDRFLAILDANGVEHNRWNRTNQGWEGRLRMTGANVLRGVVGKSGLFRTPDGETNLVELADNGDEAAKAFLHRWAN